MPQSAIAVLTHSGGTLYSVRRLIEEGAKLGKRVIALNPLQCGILLGSDKPTFYIGRSRSIALEAALPRLGGGLTSHDLHIIRQLELCGIPLVNKEHAILLCRDKTKTLQALSSLGIPIPRTAIFRRSGNVESLIERVGGLPVIIKIPDGTHGRGVNLCRTIDSVRGVADTLWHLDKDILIQEFLVGGHRDIRVIVIGGKVIGAMERLAKAGDFRANFHQGGSGKSYRVTAPLRQISEKASSALGLDVAGIDCIKTKKGYKVIEVNASPGFAGFEMVTGINAAGAIMEYIAGKL